jgi:high-affinity iron transporter
MIGALVITLREGLEAALLVGILLSYLTRVGRGSRADSVWLGTGLAVLASIVGGAAIFLAGGELEGASEQLFEGTALLLAVGVLSYMIVWMRRQARDLRGSLQRLVATALDDRSRWSLAALAFFVVVREGLETALFLFGATQTSSAGATVVGGVVGLVAAVGIGYGIYRGGLRLNLGTFFAVTGVLLVFFAAGMLARGVHEFVEVGALPGIVDPVWNANPVLPEESTAGSFLKALLGYSESPALVEVLAYVAYLALMLRPYVARLPLRPRATTGQTA